MSQNIEIEFKNIITKSEFEKLINHFGLVEESFFTQENHYFDTPDFALKNQGSALRIRKKNEKYELTLKQPHPDGLLETNKTLDQRTAEKIFETGEIHAENINNLIKKMDIDTNK